MFAQSSLAHWLRKQSGPLPISTVITLIRQAAGSIQQLHDQQIIHHDINPASFFVRETNTGNPEMHLITTDAEGRALTPFNKIFPANSMPVYMAPEQWTGHSVPATDQYALAVMTYELLVGRPPFQGPPAQLLESHMKAQPPTPSSLRPQITPALDTVLINALAKRPEDRFPSIAAFSNALFQAVRVPGSMVVTVPATISNGNLHAMVYISNTEAVTGTLRTLVLPRGERVVIAIPKGTYDGQMIRIDQYGTSSPTGATQTPIMLTVVMTATETNLPAIKVSPPKQPDTQVPSPPMPLPPTVIPQSPTRTNIFTTVTTFTQLSSRRKVALITLVIALLCLIILGGVGVYSLLQPNVAMPYPPNSGTLALNDLLHDNSKGYNWPNATNAGGICQFSQTAYHVLIDKQSTIHYCIAGNTSYSNFAYEAQMTILKGDGGGLIFRADGNNNKFYYFRVTQDGFYGLYLYSDTQAAHAKTLTIGRAAAIRIGTNIPNLLAIVAHDATISLYVNNQLITSISDTTYTSGQVGVAATYDTLTTEVAFNNARVWTF